MITTKKPVRDESLASRMKLACDSNADIPALNEGRLSWIRDQLRLEGLEVPLQSIFRWYHGEARPRHKNLVLLSKVIKADPAWLSVGKSFEPDVSNVQAHNSAVEGVINVTLGFMQMDGVNCAFPDEEDTSASKFHFYAIIKGKQHKVHVCQSMEIDGKTIFHVPTRYEKLTILAAVRKSGFGIKLFHISPEWVAAHGEHKGGFIELVADVSTGFKIGTRTLAEVKDFTRL